MELNTEFENLLKKLRQARPEERSELSRRYAVTITELEKVHAYFVQYVLDENQTE